MNAFHRVTADLSTHGRLSPTDAEVPEVCAYNRRHRPGAAQVVNGCVVYRGYLSIETTRTLTPPCRTTCRA